MSDYLYTHPYLTDLWCAGQVTSLAATSPDVLSRGVMPWARAMGADACVSACRLVRRISFTHSLIDSFTH